MFDFVRNHTRLALGFMLLLIIPSFVFVGVQGYSRFAGSDGTTVARVDGQSITRAEWTALHERAIDRVRRQTPGLDAKSLDTPQLRRETLDGILRERVLLAAASAMHLTPSDARLQRLFVTDPQYAQVRNPDGSVNRELLAMQGLSSEGFAQQLRQGFGMQQVMAGITRSAFATSVVAAAALDPLLQRRALQLQRFDALAYRARVNPSEAEIEAYFKTQEANFRAPEQAAIEYVVLDIDALSKGAAVSDGDVQKFFADNAARYTTPEERRVSHILIKTEANAPDAERKQARTRAEALLAEVRKTPASFADVARKNSQDTASATQGGDLDFFGRGNMVKAFDAAAFGIKPGDISDLVETEFGFHILTVTGVRGGDKKALADVRGEIEMELRKAQAQRRWAELAEQFTNTVYEQSDSLQPVIDKLKLEKKTATVKRTVTPGDTGPLASAKLLDAVFGNDAVANKRNTDAIETGANRLVSARVVQHTPARTQALAEVRDRVRERLVAQQAQALALKDGLARLAELQIDTATALPVAVVVSRAQPQGLPRAALEAALRVDSAKLPAVTGVDLGSEGYIVLRVTEVMPREAAPGGDDAMRGQYVQAWAGAEADAYLAALKKRFKAEIKPAADEAAEAPAAPSR